jgi:hypothetical protein
LNFPVQVNPQVVPSIAIDSSRTTCCQLQLQKTANQPPPPPCLAPPPGPSCFESRNPHRVARSKLPMARTTDPDAGVAGPPSLEPDVEAAVTTQQQRYASEDGGPLTRGDPGASTSSSASAAAPADVTDADELRQSAQADAHDQEGAVVTVDGDLVRVSSAREMCRKNKSLAWITPSAHTTSMAAC